MLVTFLGFYSLEPGGNPRRSSILRLICWSSLPGSLCTARGTTVA
jgi:hypothetical protein